MSEQKFSKLRVFLSWSGNRSKTVAQAFRDWLPSVLQNVQPYFTPDDIEKGARWSGEIRTQLGSTDFGVIFLTPENINAPWILFEAGALSKLDTSRVAPLLLGMEPAEVSGPLGQLQLTRFNKDDCFKLIESINRGLGDMGLNADVLATVFNRAWPELEEKVKAVMETAPARPVAAKRSERDMLEEVLELLRVQQGRINAAFHPPLPRAALQLGPGLSDVLNTTIENVPLTVRARNSLREMGVLTIEDLLKFSQLDLLKFPNFGKKSVSEVTAMLASYGIAMRES